jgi:hypothetical protein
VRATTTPSPFTRPRAAAGLAAAALALSLVPGSAHAAENRAPVDVRLKVADQAPVEVATLPQVWPTELLEAHGVAVGHLDKVAVVRDGKKMAGKKKRVRQGDVVRLTQVEKQRKVKLEKVRKGTVEVFTTKLKPGKRKVVSTGRAGERKIVAMKTLHNGEAVKYRVIRKKLVKEPRPRRVLVGREAYSVPGADGLNWGALAGCESGGNPKAVNPAGYYGLYQFDIGTWRSVGGSGVPTSASAAEQTYRAKLLYQQRGRSPWPNCGRLL